MERGGGEAEGGRGHQTPERPPEQEALTADHTDEGERGTHRGESAPPGTADLLLLEQEEQPEQRDTEEQEPRVPEAPPQRDEERVQT